MRYVIDLTALGDHPVDQVGGKAYSLGALARMEIPIPPGFCLTTDAFAKVVQDGERWNEINSLLARCDVVSQTSVLRASRAIEEVILEHDFPAAIATELEAAYGALLRDASTEEREGLALAVRSSATTEDSPGESFAGQFESFLDVASFPALTGAIRRCWASLFGARALSYMMKHGLDVRRARMAVIFQRMVHADVSGIAFSADPRTGDRNTIVVNANWGLGDAIVGGHVPTDEYIIEKKNGTLVTARIATKTSMSVPGAKGVLTKVPDDRQREPALSEGDLQELVAILLRIEEGTGTPQDVEWVRLGREWLVVQARPITTGTLQRENPARNPPPLPQADLAPGPWTRRFLNEWFVQPVTPLFETLQLPSLIGRANQLFRERLGSGLDDPPYSVVDGYLYVKARLTSEATLRLPRRINRETRVLPSFWRDEVVPAHLNRIRALRTVSIAGSTDEQLADYIGEVADINAEYFAWNIYTGVFSMMTESVLKAAFRAAFPTTASTSYADLLAGYPNKSMEADARLWEACELIRTDPALAEQLAGRPALERLDLLGSAAVPQELARRWREVVQEYGHRVFDLDLYMPTALEDPLSLAATLKACVEGEEGWPNPETMLDRALVRRQEREAELRRSARGKALLPIVRRAQTFAAIRESRPFYLHMGWPLLRQAVLQIGSRLVERGCLAYANDVCFLQWDEAIAALNSRGSGLSPGELAEFIGTRRERWERQRALVPPTDLEPNWLLRRMARRDRKAATGHDTENELTGVSGSGGRATGPARIVLGPDAFGTVRRGDIVIAPYTTPAWTSLFGQIDGLVTDVGGSLSHGAIVAREYGIPAVLGATGATRMIPDGQVVEVDGDRGIVKW